MVNHFSYGNSEGHSNRSSKNLSIEMFLILPCQSLKSSDSMECMEQLEPFQKINSLDFHWNFYTRNGLPLWYILTIVNRLTRRPVVYSIQCIVTAFTAVKTFVVQYFENCFLSKSQLTKVANRSLNSSLSIQNY